MRTGIIKTSLEIPVPIDKPDLNGVMYTEKAIIDACEKANNLPIVMYGLDDNTKVIGVATKVKYEDGHILVNGCFRYGGTEETVVFGDENKIVSMEIVGFGISD